MRNYEDKPPLKSYQNSNIYIYNTIMKINKSRQIFFFAVLFFSKFKTPPRIKRNWKTDKMLRNISSAINQD